MDLQGYGIELQIKNTEYRTMDPKARPKALAPEEFAGIRFGKLIREYPDLDFKLNLLREKLLSQSQELTQLKVWELADFGLRAIQNVMQEDEDGDDGGVGQLKRMVDQAQNFPNRMEDVMNSDVTEDVREALKAFRAAGIGAGTSEIYLGGKRLNTDTLTIWTLYELIRDEMKFHGGLARALQGGTTGTVDAEKKNLLVDSLVDLKTQIHEERQFSQSQGRYRIFESAEDRDKRVFWLTDVETDPKFRPFPADCNAMLQPPQFGRRRPLCRKNVFNFILFLDPATSDGVQQLIAAQTILGYGAPFRVGIVWVPFSEFENDDRPTTTTSFVDVGVLADVDADGAMPTSKLPLPLSTSSQLIAVLEDLKNRKGVGDAVNFEVYFRDFLLENDVVSEEALEAEFSEHVAGAGSLDDVVRANADVPRSTRQWVRQKGLPKAPFVYLNGKILSLQDEDFRNIVNAQFNDEYEAISGVVRTGSLRSTSDDTMETLLDGLDPSPVYHSLIVDSPFDPVSSVEAFASDLVLEIVSSEDSSPSFTHLMCLDFSVPGDTATFRNALLHAAEKEDVRLGVIQHSSFSAEIDELVRTHRTDPLALFEALEGVPMEVADDADVARGTAFCQSQSMVVTNGRAVPIARGDPPFSVVHFELMISYVESVTLSVEGLLLHEVPNMLSPNLLMDIVYHLLDAQGDSSSSSSNLPSSRSPPIVDSENTNAATIQIPGSGARVVAVIDPLSKFAQKFGPWLVMLTEFFGFPLTVYLNPRDSFSEAPLNSWYRFVLFPNLKFSQEDGSIQTDHVAAHFSELPSQYILTTYTDESETWLLESTFAEHDLDNINLDSVGEDEVLYARYQLENIVLIGSVFDVSKQTAPRGLQFTLRDIETHDDYDDTLVMANLGYFQLKANPGVFDLEIAEGRHREIFSLHSLRRTTLYESQRRSSFLSSKSFGEEMPFSVQVPLTHFDGPFYRVSVRRRPGMEEAELADSDAENGGGSGSWISSWFGGKGSEEKDTEGEEDEGSGMINIFSVASGHLYERLLKIMIKSVMVQTKRSRPKFWIIKNYLSPQFKEFLPHMSEEYGFDYAFVTYKWPHWLNKQTNKIRIIWAYKVLFLDVLFPLHLDKIVYVDSDQVTRADMTELWDIDMKGRAVAYTPFCSDKPEMDGYMFWNKGYWKNHLQGRPYHISALYIVDLDRFRTTYAGDQYRVIYDNLSKDPGSLANLDQDLPNFAQHQIPIHSLPPEWLWCETWCSQTSKEHAKTIDLCNNPVTKEHKVEQAKRIVSEWIAYDAEITRFTEVISEKYNITAK